MCRIFLDFVGFALLDLFFFRKNEEVAAAKVQPIKYSFIQKPDEKRGIISSGCTLAAATSSFFLKKNI
jgi:hypothetical protein